MPPFDSSWWTPSPMSMSMSAEYVADVNQLTRQAMTLGYEAFSFLVPPLYTVTVLAMRGRSSFTLNRLLRATWIGGLAGTAASGGLAYTRYVYSSEQSVRARRVQNAYDLDRIRRDDHATIGAILMAVLTPAILWKRVNIVNVILGGAGIGSSIGLLTHYGRSFYGDTPSPSTSNGNVTVNTDPL